MTPARPGIATAFTSLKYPNYRLWFGGQLASLAGTWMQSTAQGFLVFELTHDPAVLGYVGFAAGAPLWLFALAGGLVSDRLPRRKLLLITQTTMMLLAFVLAGLTFAGVVQAWHVILLAFLNGVAYAFDTPARQALVPDLVGREDLSNGIALTTSMVMLAAATGPALAGITYAYFGPAWCFTLNGISFLAVIGALLAMRLSPQAARPAQAPLTALREGVRYSFSHPIIRVLLGALAISTIFGLVYSTLLPAWAVKVLRGDSTLNGMLQSARGIGSLLSAMLIAALGRTRIKGKLLTLGAFAYPLLLIAWSLIRIPWLALLALVGVGWGLMLVVTLTNTLIQTLVSDELRGRVMSVFTLCYFGMMPVSALLAGWLARRFGEPATVLFGASVALLVAVVVWMAAPQLRAQE